MRYSLARLHRRLPFFYGWVVVACAISVGAPRGIVGATTLGVFTAPMADELGWSRTLLAGAMSTGALVATPLAPLAGRLLDRYGARLILSGSALLMGLSVMALSVAASPLGFYVPFTVARAIFTGPLEVGMTTAVSNWFIRLRPRAIATLNVSQFLGLALLPPLTSAIIVATSWRTGWLSLGLLMLAVGVLPSALFLVRRPEDMGLLPDGDTRPATPEAQAAAGQRAFVETNFTLSQALRTPTLWLIMGYTAAAFMFHGGVSLHQIPHFIAQGLSPVIAATMASAFAISQATGSLAWGIIARRMPLRVALALTSVCMIAAALVMAQATTVPMALLSVILFGIGLSGTFVLVPVIWADYYGRENLGTIRGVALMGQTGGATVGPILGGVVFDLTQSYQIAFYALAAAVLIGGIMALSARRPSFPGVR